ncbi:hypothetical protein XENORESO_021001 [Xenotaenia resolanae]|uniref:Transmembrane protein 220 n=2 Tax=Goodeidae TaxID=28758 RepID=A0ABV0X9K0_9TELE
MCSPRRIFQLKTLISSEPSSSAQRRYVRRLTDVFTSRRPGRGGEIAPFQTTMGEVCEEKNSKSWLSVVWRISNVVMSVFFVLASYVQINDPDASLWMVGYGVPAVLCAFLGFRPHVTETLPWRRVADLHLMISSAAIFILGWKLYTERVTQIFQQEEGRYAAVSC